MTIYFDFYINDYVEYLFSPKKIVIDKEEIQLPNGYYYSISRQLQSNEIEITVRNYRLKSIIVDYMVEQEDCDEKLKDRIGFFKYQFADPVYIYRILNYKCRFNDTDVYLVKRPKFISFIGFIDNWYILIPSKCMKIEINERDINQETIFKIINLIAFNNAETNIEFVEWE